MNNLSWKHNLLFSVAVGLGAGLGSYLFFKTNQIDTESDRLALCKAEELAKKFMKDSILVWHDPNIYNAENSKYIEILQEICDLKTFTDWKEASKYVKETEVICHTITSGTNGELLVKEIENQLNVASIYVFTLNKEFHSQWTCKYPKVISVENRIEILASKIDDFIKRWQREKGSLRLDLPNFAPIFDDADKHRMYFMQLHLKECSTFKNLSQAKNDFLKLAKEIFPDKGFQEKFRKAYNGYNMKKILYWYTEQCFVYKAVNNCLRIATLDSIQYCRLILKDLEMAIKEQYNAKSKNFNGLLYRGGYISNPEWEMLENNIEKDIEMYGFLSTSKNKKSAMDFAKNLFITIIVPAAPDLGVQGFAEVKEFSAFPNEEEVLFNVRSRFTILDARSEIMDGKELRHVILLFGARAIAEYLTVKKPSITVALSLHQKCNICDVGISFKEQLLYADLSKPSQFTCAVCARGPSVTPLLCIPLSEKLLGYLSQAESLTFEVNGLVSLHRVSLNGLCGKRKCFSCNGVIEERCHKCLTCDQQNQIWCEGCQDRTKECLGKGHQIILERSPLSFWYMPLQEIDLLREELNKTRINYLFKAIPLEHSALKRTASFNPLFWMDEKGRKSEFEQEVGDLTKAIQKGFNEWKESDEAREKVEKFMKAAQSKN